MYNGVFPPESGLILVLAACDVAWGGGDSLSMPFGYEYDNTMSKMAKISGG